MPKLTTRAIQVKLSECVSIAVATRVCGVSARTMERWIASGDMPMFKKGGVRRIELSDLVAFKDKHKHRVR